MVQVELSIINRLFAIGKLTVEDAMWFGNQGYEMSVNNSLVSVVKAKKYRLTSLTAESILIT